MASLKAWLLCALLAAADLAAAEKALAAGKPSEALRLLGALPEAEDAPVRALLLAGRAHLALDDPSSAVEPLLRAAELQPDDADTARLAAQACYRSGLEAQRRQAREARLWLHDALRYAERSNDALLLASVQESLGRPEEALKSYRKAADQERDPLAVWEGQGRCLRMLGRDEYKQAFGKALDVALQRRDVGAAWRTAFAADEAARLLRWLDEEVKKNPDAVWARRWRGFAREKRLLYAGAVEDLRWTVGKTPHDRPARQALVGVLLASYRSTQQEALLDEAEQHARALLEGDVPDALVISQVHWTAWTHLQAGRPARAVALLRLLHRTAPRNLDVGLSLAAQLRRGGDLDEAGEVYRVLLDSYPDDPDVLNDLAILEDGRGNRSAARKLWKRALEEDPEHLSALENLFTDSWERGDSVQAHRWVARGLAAAELQSKSVNRWKWFRDRLLWAPRAFGTEDGSVE